MMKIVVKTHLFFSIQIVRGETRFDIDRAICTNGITVSFPMLPSPSSHPEDSAS